MVEVVLMSFIALSFIGMVASSLHDPLGEKFWEDIPEIISHHLE